MGGCVSSIMSSKNDGSVIPHPDLQYYRARSRVVTEIAPATDDCSPTYISSLTNEIGDPSDIRALQKKMFNSDVLTVTLNKACKKFADRPAMAFRPLDHIEKKEEVLPNGKKRMLEITHLKPTVHVSFTSLWEKVQAFGAGLTALGVTPNTHVGLYEETRMEWMVACHGIWYAGAIGVTVYANLGEDALKYAIQESELDFIFCNGKLIKNILPLRRDKTKKVTFIYTDEITSGLDLDGCEAIRFDAILEKGRAELAANKNAADAADNLDAPSPFTPKPADTALIMYTSGTTGDPKGVVMLHGNVSSAIALLFHRLKSMYPDPEFRYVYAGFLPLAHILEFAAEMVMITHGAMVGYGSPRTLTDATAKPHGDLTEFQPHFIVAVPRVWDTIRKAVETNIPAGLKRRIFDDAYASRWKYLQNGQETPYYNEKVFAAIKQRLGGRCTTLLSGGGPLSEKTLEFLWVTTGCTVVQGYGSTESCTIATTQQRGELDLDSVGAPLETVELKLRDTEEWKHTDLPFPRGEILIRNSAVNQGYYKQPEKTKEVFTEDGWYCSGDVGALNKDGNIRIIGRVKALAKNAFGEYIALEALETLYCLNDLAQANGVCLLVHKSRPYICALVLTDEAKTMKFAKANGISGTYPEILNDATFQKKANESFIATAKQYKKKNFETVRAVKLLAEEWTPENGIMTAAQKLRRTEVDRRYTKQIDELFASEE